MVKKRDFAFLLYPENCNPNFISTLERLKTPVFYILHDKDVELDEETGKMIPKKPHYHVMIIFKNPRSENTAKKISLECGGNGFLLGLTSRTGYARYLMHLDDLHKHHYERDEVKTLNDTGNMSYDNIIKTSDDRTLEYNAILADIITYCGSNHLIAFASLLEYAVLERREWISVIRRNTHLITEYIKSKYWLQGLE